jgi:hypothetical protein
MLCALFPPLQMQLTRDLGNTDLAHTIDGEDPAWALFRIQVVRLSVLLANFLARVSGSFLYKSTCN